LKYNSVIPVQTEIQACPYESRELYQEYGFSASNAGQALLLQEWQKVERIGDGSKEAEKLHQWAVG
jgi:hypothetical protein